MKILFIGDIVGKPGREAVAGLVPALRSASGIDFVIANAENSSGGSGITPQTAGELFDASVDVLTAGDHIWKRKEIFELIRFESKIIRPANFPAGAPGRGFGVFRSASGIKVGVVNVLGRVFLEPLDCPFRAVRAAVEQIRKETNVILVDIHAEATSEKIAMGWYLDGDVSAVVGTHTHVQTADERVLPKGTAYITDAGMAGPFDSVLGRRVEDVLERFLGCVPVRFEVAGDNVQMHGVIVDIDEKTGCARSIERIQKRL
ncbi:MAG TPA: TIGR00282 family metallophosphoesterase [Candidatus Omnitrophota bacterium]|nr:TIGR00282 family metallophosphoesterase [Candidatus Omnitrophota bacterium]HNQ49988.1 TIGR00282 family metallophosphoesterase [Candidatus Omnitrophota bacterium]